MNTSMKNLKKGDKVKTCDGLILEVLYADESTVETYERRRCHPTKVFPVVKHLTGAMTELEMAVQSIINKRGRDEGYSASDFLEDLFYGGCESGIVAELVYYRDTIAWYKRYREDISALLYRYMDYIGQPGLGAMFGDKWEAADPLALEDCNQNLLAWWSFEETARELACRSGIEV